MTSLLKSFVVAVFCIVTCMPSPAQTFQTLTSFKGAYVPYGTRPAGKLVEGTDGNLYGTTSLGGPDFSKCDGQSCGTIFQVTPSGVLSTLYDFCSLSNCTDGSYPDAGLIQGLDGNFYGTTRQGGDGSSQCPSGGCGTVFQLASSGLTTMHSFCSGAQCADGSFPSGGLVQGSDGTFYGATSEGGASNNGTIYKLTSDRVLTTLHSFCALANCADGASPGGLIQGSDGNFYGFTAQGGQGVSSSCTGCGTVFQITPRGVLTTLYNFCSLEDCADGWAPSSIIQASNGNLYGTTSEGGANATGGTAFELTPGGVLTTLYNFCSLAKCADGTDPGSLLQGADGSFYGTSGGGVGSFLAGGGTLFRLTSAGALTTLYTFCSKTNCTDGNGPGPIVQVANGTFYGPTSAGGNRSHGTVFSWSQDVNAPPTLAPSPLNFDSQNPDTSKTKILRITNVNTGTLDLTGFTVTGSSAFAISASTCGETVQAKKACTLSITFTPTEPGTLEGSLLVYDNAPGSPQTVSLTGSGK
jgi:uncharacterized repeat protein (TIGR03803 family)